MVKAVKEVRNRNKNSRRKEEKRVVTNRRNDYMFVILNFLIKYCN